MDLDEENAMAAIADSSANSNLQPAEKAGSHLDVALALHLSACRFSSPGGAAFAPQTQLLLRRKAKACEIPPAG